MTLNYSDFSAPKSTFSVIIWAFCVRIMTYGILAFIEAGLVGMW